MKKEICVICLFFCFININSLFAQSLRGSRTSVNKQYHQAILHDFTKLRNAAHVARFVKTGLLVRLRGNQNFEIDNEASHSYARPAVKLFVEHLSAQFRAACGGKLVVTSLTRPINEQPANASQKSVHPMGMAVDFRIPETIKCQRWLESTLLTLEKRGLLEATRERRPPHYHVAVFSKQYEKHVKNLKRR